MKIMILVFALLVAGDFVFGQTPSAPTSSTIPVVVLPVSLPIVPVAVAVPVVTQAPPTPPAWIVSALTAVEALPIVGPYVSKGVQYLAILGSFMTLLAGFAMGLIKLIGPKLASGTATEIETTVEGWLNSPVIFYIKYFSFFNAQKPVAQVADVAKKV